MAVTATNLIQGPGTLYTDTFGVSEPADTAVASAPGGTWVDVGGTQDGVKLTVAQEYSELEVDQVVDVPGRRLTKRDISVATNLAEPTLVNLGLALNGGTQGSGGTGGTAYLSYDPAMDGAATQPTYKALLFDGWAPNGKVRRVIVRKVLSIESIESSYKKDEQTLFPVTFAAHWVSSSIKPFHIVDGNAA